MTSMASIMRACARSRIRLRASRLFPAPEAVSLKMPITSRPAKAVSSPTWRSNEWSVSVSGNWRITFEEWNGRLERVNLEDYHR